MNIARTVKYFNSVLVSEFQSCDGFIMEITKYKTQKTNKFQITNFNDQNSQSYPV